MCVRVPENMSARVCVHVDFCEPMCMCKCVCMRVCTRVPAVCSRGFEALTGSGAVSLQTPHDVTAKTKGACQVQVPGVPLRHPDLVPVQ